MIWADWRGDGGCSEKPTGNKDAILAVKREGVGNRHDDFRAVAWDDVQVREDALARQDDDDDRDDHDISWFGTW